LERAHDLRQGKRRVLSRTTRRQVLTTRKTDFCRRNSAKTNKFCELRFCGRAT
jgi:hypothetical protein